MFSFSDNVEQKKFFEFSAPYIAVECSKSAKAWLLTQKNTKFYHLTSAHVLFDCETNAISCLDRPSPAGEDGVIEGVLTRKHEWESTTKKASNRSWDKVILNS